MRLTTETDWERRFTDLGAFWFHDGNPKRPYARLTSGKISNGFFNGGKVCERPRILGRAVHALCSNPLILSHELGERVLTELDSMRGPNTYVVGPAMGGITFAHEVADYLDARMIYAEKGADGEFELKRFEPPPPKSSVLLVEDTITTGGSILKVYELMKRVAPASRISRYVLALMNRSNSEYLGNSMTVVPLIRKRMDTWDEGKNPFTKDGTELVPPVKPKAHWDQLTKQY